MSKRDFYEVLGVDRKADDAAVKKAYRSKAMQFHPDRNPNDKAAEQKFKEVNEAYEILKDPQKRAAYDQFGHAAFDPAAGAPPGGGFRPGQGGAEFNFGGGFADIFEDIFGDITGRGRRQQQRGPERGQDLRYDLEVSLEDAFKGKKATIRVPTAVRCDACSGTGGEGGARPKTCPTCGGRGRVRATQGFFTIERSCAACHGTGEVVDKPCKTCHGEGRLVHDKTLAVNIPAGVDEGTRIRLAGEGEAGLRGGPAGDLYIFVSIAPHELFQRDGAHIYCHVPISMVTAALGGAVEVPTVEGTRARVTVPAGTQSGEQFRLRGKGMTKLQSALRGDMIIEVAVETPANLTAKQKQILEEFKKAGGEDASPKAKNFFAKVKQIWDELKG
ncbi:MAG: molecular chaperone DnaJ [Rhodospirillaceae bacterium]|nr:molecular chaperone DnaJ [Rhodospirillaceae bacterium]